MLTDRTWTYCLCAGILALLSCWEAVAHAQERLPSTGYEAGFVNYQITPLPPITEVGLPEEIPTPDNSEPEEASAEKADAEEVEPQESKEDNDEKEDGDKEKEDEIKSDLEIPLEDQSLWYFWRLWDVSYELGVNGSVGNSNTHTWRTAVRSKRATDFSVLTGAIDYKKSLKDSVTTADRLFSEWRAEFPNNENKWSWYLHGTVEFDEFRAYNSRVTEDSGIGYQWYKNDVGSFITRTGLGVSREFGGPNDVLVPEGVLGAVFERRLTKRQKLALSNEFFFDLRNFNQNRMNSKVDWEIVLDEVAHLSLKVGIINRYDSTPNGKKPNDLDYSTVFLWAF